VFFHVLFTGMEEMGKGKLEKGNWEIGKLGKGKMEIRNEIGEKLKMHDHPHAQLAVGEVIRDGVGSAGYVFYPVIGKRVLYLQQIVHFDAYPKRFHKMEWI
jgi:hypothetical protein